LRCLNYRALKSKKQKAKSKKRKAKSEKQNRFVLMGGFDIALREGSGRIQ